MPISFSAAKWRKRPYSLAELLVVICIVGILFGAALPAFSRLLKGSGVSNGARLLASKVNGSRSYALSNRCCVALVFPINATSDPNVPDSLRYRAFRPAVVLVSGSSSSSPYTFLRWVEGEPWTFMPQGSFFGGPECSSNALTTGGNGLNDFVASQSVANCDFSDISSNSAGAITNCVVFRPDGSLGGGSALSKPFSMGVWEGGVESGSTPMPTNRSDMAVVTVNQFTGRASCSGR